MQRQGDLLETILSRRGSTVVNKMLHLIISPLLTGPELIVAVDGNSEACRIIRWLDNRGFPVFLGKSRGLLHCVSLSGHPDCSELSVWALEDYDAAEWNLKHTVSFLELFGKETCQFGSDYHVAIIHPERNLVFLCSTGTINWYYMIWIVRKCVLFVMLDVIMGKLLLMFPISQSHQCSRSSETRVVFGQHSGNGIENGLQGVWCRDHSLRALSGSTKVNKQPDYNHGGEGSVLSKQVSDYVVSNYQPSRTKQL